MMAGHTRSTASVESEERAHRERRLAEILRRDLVRVIDPKQRLAIQGRIMVHEHQAENYDALQRLAEGA